MMGEGFALAGGIYPPIPTFFHRDDTLDLASLQTHIRWLLDRGVAGILTLGSNGEAMHLSDTERVAVIRATREAFSQHSRQPNPPPLLLAGAADLSTHGTIIRCTAAAEAGADAVVVLPPFAFPTQMTPAALRAHFTAVAEASPIPVIIYNMPANAANIDLSADLIIELAQHPNIIGVKDSSGNVTKLAQIAAQTPVGFAVLAGSGSFLIPTLSIGGTGAIAAVANVVPDLLVKLYQQWTTRFDTANVVAAHTQEIAAQQLQAQIIPLNQLVTATYGVAGLKAALQLAHGYGGMPRAPLLPLNEQQQTTIQHTYETLQAATATIS